MQFGSRGWQHRTWVGSFYPDDLPSEWRLPFYSNEFTTVLIPSSELLNTDAEQIQEWLEDSTENFSFFVEFDSRQEFSAQFQMAQALRPQLAGVVLDAAVSELSISAQNLMVLASNTLGEGIQLYAPDTGVKNGLAPSDTQLVYNIMATFEHSARRHCLGLLKSNSLSTTALTELLGALHKIDGGCSALFMAGQKPDVELIRQATTIYELSY